MKLLERAAKQLKRTPYYKSHSSGVIKYLREILGKEVPEPSYVHDSLPFEESEEVDRNKFEETNSSFSLNTILFGPPGTGKTYTVQRKAVETVEPSAAKLLDGEIGEKFRRYRDEGRIEFVTFHPSFSYEEFVEGFRYDPEKKTPTLHKGILREISQRALNPHQRMEVREGARIWKVSLGGYDAPQLFERCIKNDEIAIGWFDMSLSGYDREMISQLFREKHPGERRTHNINSVNYFVNEIREGDYIAVLKNQREIRAIGVVSGGYLHKEQYDEYPHTRPVNWLDLRDHDIYEMNGSFNMVQPTVYPLDRISLQDFVALLRNKERRNNKPYVLIIDEINRGNISRIFGELITLLETDKRLGAPNELSVKLPYSKEDFSVPGNLHVIGTMNTADRSIALLDVALRRRFEFEEMMPDVEVVRTVLKEKGAETNVERICEVFQILNARISALLDRDHQIGHSYFLAATLPEDLHHALYKRVFPLLQEYFYNDTDQLTKLLGEYEGSESRGFVKKLALDFGRDFTDDRNSDTLWKFHDYGKAEIEEALRRTFIEE